MFRIDFRFTPDSVAKLGFIWLCDVRFYYKRTFPVPLPANAGAGFPFWLVVSVFGMDFRLFLGLAVVCRRIWPAFSGSARLR